MTAIDQEIHFPDVATAIDAVMTRRITVYPCHANRASAIGDDCLRRLVYERTSWREKKRHDVGLEYVFEVGRTLEWPVMNLIHEAGFETIRQQEPFEYRSNGELLCNGHIDAILVDRDGNNFVAEVKTMSPNMWEAVHCEADMRKKPWTRRYPPQLHLYMFGLEIPNGMWILVNKSTGRIKQVNTSINIDLCESLLVRCETINRHVKDGTYPDRLEPTPENADICRDCPFFHLCLPAINNGDLKLVIDADLAGEIDEMQSLEGLSKRYNELKERLERKFELTGTTRAAIGNWLFAKKRTWSASWTRLAE